MLSSHIYNYIHALGLGRISGSPLYVGSGAYICPIYTLWDLEKFQDGICRKYEEIFGTTHKPWDLHKFQAFKGLEKSRAHPSI